MIQERPLLNTGQAVPEDSKPFRKDGGPSTKNLKLLWKKAEVSAEDQALPPPSPHNKEYQETLEGKATYRHHKLDDTRKTGSRHNLTNGKKEGGTLLSNLKCYFDHVVIYSKDDDDFIYLNILILFGVQYSLCVQHLYSTHCSVYVVSPTGFSVLAHSLFVPRTPLALKNRDDSEGYKKCENTVPLL